MITYFKVDRVMSQRQAGPKHQGASSQASGAIQRNIAHIKSEFASKQGTATDTSGRKDALDNEFEEY